MQLAAGLRVDLLDDVAQGRFAAELREVDRARSAVVQGVTEYRAEEGRVLRLHAHAVVQGVQLEVAGEREDIRCRRPSCRSASIPDSPSEAAVVPPLTSWTWRFETFSSRVVGQNDMPVIGRGGHVDRARAVDRLDHVVDVLGVGEIDHSAGAAAVGDAYFTGSETLPAVDFGQTDALVDRVAVTESERSAAQGRGGA